MKNSCQDSTDIIVLNSLALLPGTEPLLHNYEIIHFYIHNDEAGINAGIHLKEAIPKAIDHRMEYLFYKDLNEFFTEYYCKDVAKLNRTLAYALKNGLSVAVIDTESQGSLTSLLLMMDGIKLLPLPDNLEGLKKFNADILIIDTPPYLSTNLINLFEISDCILIPTKASFFDMMATRATITVITASSNPWQQCKIRNFIKYD